jgi:hypothetical protein
MESSKQMLAFDKMVQHFIQKIKVGYVKLLYIIGYLGEVHGYFSWPILCSI